MFEGSHTVTARCNSWKCEGEERTFHREIWREPSDIMTTPMGQRRPSGLRPEAYCEDCRMYSHIPLKGDELLPRGGSDKRTLRLSSVSD